MIILEARERRKRVEIVERYIQTDQIARCMLRVNKPMDTSCVEKGDSQRGKCVVESIRTMEDSWRTMEDQISY